ATQRNATSPISPSLTDTLQVKSKQRVADFGEVYTNEREVNAMLDLVKDQATNPDRTFLEPACGTGNFLVEILRRKLEAVAKKHKKIQYDYERYAILSVGSLYGIDILKDNVEACRKRLLAIFTQHYQAQFPKTYQEKCIRSAEVILSKNILHGDALSLKQADGNDIVFTEWKPLGNQLQRRDFVYRNLVHNLSDSPGFSEDGKEEFIPTSIQDYPLIHFLEVGNDHAC
ncbi:DNA methyltransferase, partial [Rodentibacter caecimuris]|uniref:DNA methyltransferase n=1 Tax=Rodentibacter caecimuris TaxID=1796644 RepID=UPI002FFC8F0D